MVWLVAWYLPNPLAGETGAAIAYLDGSPVVCVRGRLPLRRPRGPRRRAHVPSPPEGLQELLDRDHCGCIPAVSMGSDLFDYYRVLYADQPVDQCADCAGDEPRDHAVEKADRGAWVSAAWVVCHVAFLSVGGEDRSLIGDYDSLAGDALMS